MTVATGPTLSEYLDADILEPLNRTLEGLFYVIIPGGERCALPCGGVAEELLADLSDTEQPTSGVAPGGWRYRSRPLTIPRLPPAHLVELRSPDCQGPDLLEAVTHLVRGQAQARFELQSTVEELIAKYDELSVLYDSAQTIASTMDLEEVCNRILERAAEILSVDHASLMLLDDDRRLLKVVAARGTRAARVGRLQVKVGEGIAGWVAREGRPLLIEDLKTHPIGRQAVREDDQARSLLSVPLHIKDKVLGVLNVTNKTSGEPFYAGDLKLLSALARMAAISIENARTYQNAITDRLTRLYNYGYFREQLEKEVEASRQTGDPLSLLMFDIDHFKNFNDVNGHELANVALVGVSSICLENCRQKGDRIPDLVARYGGEEFMIMLRGVGKEEAGLTAERIRQAVESEHFEGGENQPMGRVTISMGVATFPDDAGSSEELINRVDQALYEAKRGGRNAVRFA